MRGASVTRGKALPELIRAIRRAIETSGLSLNQLGVVSGVDRGRLSRFMRGERDLTLNAAARLCEVLDLHVSPLQSPALTSPDPPKPEPVPLSGGGKRSTKPRPK